MYSGLHKLYPDDYCTDMIAIEDSGKLAVLSVLLKNIHSNREKTVLVSNHTKVKVIILEHYILVCNFDC